MKRQLLGGAVLALAACATTTTAAVAPLSPLAAAPDVTAESLLAMNALCGAEDRFAGELKTGLKLVEGMGTGGFRIDSDNPDAQAWFDYGLKLSHGFYHLDAIAAMKKAAAADPNCARCAWGEAFALGPTLNYDIAEDERVLALAAAERARSLVNPSDAMAVRLIDAAIARYQKSETSLAVAYSEAMQAIAKDFPDEIEVSVIAAHVMLIPVRDGEVKTLKPALALLESVLARSPEDTGAIHYYIHGTEFDGRAEDALPYARKLGGLAPMASHLVHMPAHTFFRAGLYHDAAKVNALAIGADTDWMVRGGDPGAPASLYGENARPAKRLPMYYSHNLAFGLAGALMSGDGELALKYASHAATVYDPAQPSWLRSYPVARTYVALARYAPERALAIPEDGSDPRFAIYRHYARGEALVLKGDLAGARAELKALNKLTKGGRAEGKLAKAVLEGRIAMARGDHAKAARIFGKAAALQEKDLARSWDPPAWWYPVRRSAAAAHLKAGDHAKAEAEARASLAGWTDDPLAMWVLGQALKGQGRTEEGDAMLAKARPLWFGEFSSITAEVI